MSLKFEVTSNVNNYMFLETVGDKYAKEVTCLMRKAKGQIKTPLSKGRRKHVMFGEIANSGEV